METKTPDTVNLTPDWLRLREVIQFSGMSVNAFALHIGLPRSENLYQIKKGNHGISKALAETIHRFYPSFSVGWLLSGEPGKTMPPDAERIELHNDSLRRIPVYNRLAEGTRPIYHLYISEESVNGAELAVINRDESLSPRIPVGSVVFIKPSVMLFPGKFYLIATADHTLIRKIRTGDAPGELFLESPDPQKYGELSLFRDKIENLYSVEKVLADV